MKAANLLVRFVLELAALAALIYSGFELGSTVLADVVLAVAMTAAFVAIWGRWIAPRASARLADAERLWVELALFGVVVAALAAAAHPIMAAVFAVLVLANELLLLAWDQRGTA